VWTAWTVNSEETINLIRMVYAHKLPKTVMPRDRSNWLKINAIDAKHAQLVRHSIVKPDNV
jgi:hypothetical protein